MNIELLVELVKIILRMVFKAFEVDKEFEALGIDIYEVLAPNTEIE